MTNQILEIEGDLVKVTERKVIKQIKLESLMPHLVRKDPVTFPVLPASARFVHFDPTTPNMNKLYILAEIPPGIRTITKENKNAVNKRRYRLAFPWTYFWFTAVQEGGLTRNYTITDYRCFHARQRFEGPPGEFYVAFCPNVYKDNATICFGSTGAPPGPIDQQIDHIVNNWYVSEFNDHLDRTDMAWPFGGNSFKNWVDRTATDGPSAWKNFPEWDSGIRKKFTITDLIGQGVVRITQMTGELVIPEIPTPMTFGRAEEWWRGLSPVNRGRLKVAMGNLIEDDPDSIEMPPAIVEVTDDGGVPV
jgi:hypothetical protein